MLNIGGQRGRSFASHDGTNRGHGEVCVLKVLLSKPSRLSVVVHLLQSLLAYVKVMRGLVSRRGAVGNVDAIRNVTVDREAGQILSKRYQ